MGGDRCGHAESARGVPHEGRRELSRGSRRHGSRIQARSRSARRRSALMAVRAFEPHFMKVGILSAALQELTPRQVRDADPDRAIEDWIAYAAELGADELQLSAAIHPSEADVPPE